MDKNLKRPLLLTGLIIALVCFSFLTIGLVYFLYLFFMMYGGAIGAPNVNIATICAIIFFGIVELGSYICGIVFSAISLSRWSLPPQIFARKKGFIITSFVFCIVTAVFELVASFASIQMFLPLFIGMSLMVVSAVFIMVDTCKNKKYLIGTNYYNRDVLLNNNIYQQQLGMEDVLAQRRMTTIQKEEPIVETPKQKVETVIEKPHQKQEEALLSDSNNVVINVNRENNVVARKKETKSDKVENVNNIHIENKPVKLTTILSIVYCILGLVYLIFLSSTCVRNFTTGSPFDYYYLSNIFLVGDFRGVLSIFVTISIILSLVIEIFAICYKQKGIILTNLIFSTFSAVFAIVFVLSSAFYLETFISTFTLINLFVSIIMLMVAVCTAILEVREYKKK